MMLVIISGRSGSGKSVALRALEDAGFYCVDNLPVALLPDLAKTLIKTNRSAAVSIDIRNLPENNDEFKAALDNIPENFKPKLVFLDTDRDTLIRRYSNTRRLHPLSTQDLTLEEAIDKEYVLLEYLHQHADHVIDTTKLSVHELSELLRLQLLHTDQKELHIVIESFGFKHGIPKDADYVFDVRFLPNPHWVPELQSLTGLDAPVKDFLQQHTEVHKFIYQTRNYLELWLPYLEKNNRSYLTIAIGCTGGQHRSVYVAEELGNYFRLKNKNVQTRHRTLLAEKQNIE